MVKDDGSEDSDKGMLNDLDDGGSYDFGEKEEEEKIDEADELFAMGADPHSTLKRMKTIHDIAKSRQLNAVTAMDYLLNPSKRDIENPYETAGEESYKTALFYMYGACDGVDEDKLVVHNLLKRF